MNLITVAFQTLAFLSCVLAGTAASFRSRWLEPLASLFAGKHIARFAFAAIFWIAGIATVLGMAVPFVAFFASCLVFVSAVLLALRIARSASAAAWPLPVLMAVASVTVAIAQPLGLRVIALPAAEELPIHPARTRVVKTYDEGLWFEGIAAADNGTLYLAGNRGLDFARSDYYHDALGEVIARGPDGSERTLFKTPRGSTAGVLAVAGDGTVYLTSHGDLPCIWRIDREGNAQRFAELPRGAWPNGLDIGPDGFLYTADSSLGAVWQIDPSSGRSKVILQGPELSARTFVALAPGANGLHFKDRELFVTVSDRATVLKYSMDDQGRFGTASVVATGIPGDDFAIGQDASLFITTHPYNTLVRVKPSGERTIIGKSEQHIVGATDAVFGKSTQDRDTLYVVTDGGAFTGGSRARGELVALQPYAELAP